MVERVKSHYPIAQDAAYAEALQRRAAELLADDHAVLELVDAAAARKVVARAPGELDLPARAGLEQLLDLAVWLDLYRPALHTV